MKNTRCLRSRRVRRARVLHTIIIVTESARSALMRAAMRATPGAAASQPVLRRACVIGEQVQRYAKKRAAFCPPSSALPTSRRCRQRYEGGLRRSPDGGCTCMLLRHKSAPYSRRSPRALPACVPHLRPLLPFARLLQASAWQSPALRGACLHAVLHLRRVPMPAMLALLLQRRHREAIRLSSSLLCHLQIRLNTHALIYPAVAPFQPCLLEGCCCLCSYMLSPGPSAIYRFRPVSLYHGHAHGEAAIAPRGHCFPAHSHRPARRCRCLSSPACPPPPPPPPPPPAVRWS